MSRRSVRGLVYIALVLFLALHNDLWSWSDRPVVSGLPAGLTYHVVYCGVAAVLMALLVRVAWSGGARPR